MSAETAQYLSVVILGVLVALFAVASLGASRLLRPRRPTPAKLSPYECGMAPEQLPRDRFPVKFYVIAMLFIVFDIEVIFLFPYAVVLRDLGLYGLVAVAIFVVLVTVAFVYEWLRGGLEWSD